MGGKELRTEGSLQGLIYSDSAESSRSMRLGSLPWSRQCILTSLFRIRADAWATEELEAGSPMVTLRTLCLQPAKRVDEIWTESSRWIPLSKSFTYTMVVVT